MSASVQSIAKLIRDRMERCRGFNHITESGVVYDEFAYQNEIAIMLFQEPKVTNDQILRAKKELVAKGYSSVGVTPISVLQ